MKKQFLVVLSILSSGSFYAQISTQQLGGTTLNPITTAVPFLMISPDSKQGAMGDVGAATDPDANSIHWNGSKLAFDKKFGVGVTVTPWLRLLVPDINMYYLAGYTKLNDKQTVGASLRYFSLGNIELTDISGVHYANYKPNEFALDLAFSQKLSKNLSLGVAARYINSGISKAYTSGSQGGNAASTFAVDLSMYYRSNKIKLADKNALFTAGLAFTNIGAKIKYSNDENFIPMNMRLGLGLKTDIDQYNTFGVYVDVNKLLVPTPPHWKYKLDASGNPTTEIEINPATGEREIEAGKNPNVDVGTGIIQSFNDAPGGFNEELKEFNESIGMEYCYNNMFAVRAGFFHEAKSKGARQYFTVGAGFKFKVISVDISYLIPTALQNPLQRTWRITLGFSFDGSNSKETEKTEP
jgi:hypothetical protein